MDKETAEWVFIAEGDSESAKMLNSAYRPNNETIYWHCSQAIEKYLKGYLKYNNINFNWDHDIETLMSKCTAINKSFSQFEEQCIGASIFNFCKCINRNACPFRHYFFAYSSPPSCTIQVTP